MNRLFCQTHRGWFQQGLKFAMSRSSGEGDDISDVLHSSNKHEHALKAHAEAGVRATAVFTEVEIPAVFVQAESFLFHVGLQYIDALLTLCAADNFANARHEEIHGGHSDAALAVWLVGAHVKWFNAFRVIINGDWALEVLLGQKSFVFRL